MFIREPHCFAVVNKAAAHNISPSCGFMFMFHMLYFCSSFLLIAWEKL